MSIILNLMADAPAGHVGDRWTMHGVLLKFAVYDGTTVRTAKRQGTGCGTRINWKLHHPQSCTSANILA